MAKFRFDDKTIRALEPPAEGNRIDYDVPATSGKGEFVRGFAIRTTRAGTKTFLLVYVTKTGRERRHKIGDLGPYTVTTAREAARKLRALVDAGADPFAEVQESRAADLAERARAVATLGSLLAAYVQQLTDAGKPSATEVGASIERNLTVPFPKIAGLPADRVSVDDVMPVFHRLTKSGKWRAAEKLAVYLRAAFTAAKSARTDAAGFAFKGFGIRVNPLADLRVSRPKSNASTAADVAQERKWALSVPQLQAYWKRLQTLQTAQGAMLRFHLLTGGQRMEQLSRLNERDRKADTVTLWDTKGRRTQARAHVLPILPDVEAALLAMRPDKKTGPYLFTVSGGAAPAVPHTLAAAMRDVSAAMLEVGEIDRRLTPGAIRRTVETLLADNGVSKDIRAQLLSHGVSGVQDRHYDAGEYLRQKREALQALRNLLEPGSDKVTPIRRKRVG
jgi:hypothetical protein